MITEAEYPYLHDLIKELQDAIRPARKREDLPASYQIAPDRWGLALSDYTRWIAAEQAEGRNRVLLYSDKVPEKNYLLLGVPVTCGELGVGPI